MAKQRKFFTWGRFFLGFLVAGFIGIYFVLPNWLAHQATRVSVELEIGSARWAFPVGVTFSDIVVREDSAVEGEPIFRAKRLTAKVPLWGLLVKPRPIALWLEEPHLIVDSDQWGRFLETNRFLPTGASTGSEATWDPDLPARLLEQLPLVPMGLSIEDGSMDIWNALVRSDGPLMKIAHMDMKVTFQASMSAPSVRLKSKMDFVTDEGKPHGYITADVESSAYLDWMKGKIAVWHGKLEDFGTLYTAAPEPFVFTGGAGGPTFRWHYRDDYIKASVQTITEHMAIDGVIGETTWNEILDSVKDDAGRIDLLMEVEGSLNDPSFDLHNAWLLSLDDTLRQRASAKGVPVPSRLFYGVVEPSLE